MSAHMAFRLSLLTRQWGRFPLSSRPVRPGLRAASTSPRRLDLLAVDKKWKDRWRDDPTAHLVKNHGKEKAYILAMFPYPSGTLHMGHVRVYTIADMLARFKHMKGYDVLHPMGWDAFGLPAENAAIERGIDPAQWTMQNIANMKEQLRAIGAHFDWNRELMTCSPEFYKHTQRLFLMLYGRGLAYQAKALVNYDPVDKTVLANEQVNANGCSWRSGAKVKKVELKQWFFRITAFKEALLKDLDALADGWPERVLSMQRHWLGKSTGAHIKFLVSAPDDNYDIQVFTTRPDTLHGVQYLALSITHPLVVKLSNSDTGLKFFLESVASLPQDSKAGYRLPGVMAVNPLSSLEANPSLQSSIPVYVAPYVLAEYGEGAVMGVPGHDSRDFAFWNENSESQPVSFVIKPKSSQEHSLTESSTSKLKPFTGKGILADTCGSYGGMASDEGGSKIVADLKRQGNFANIAENWRLRDWLVSRQRYWGAPIPIIHCDSCGPVPVPIDQLPVELPVIEGDVGLRGKQGNPLESAEEWLHTSCPSCGGAAKRETDTMDTFVDSSWYFLRYLDPFNKTAPFSASTVQPVDVYIGGIEHAILHLLYSRFIYKFLATTELFPKEPSGPAAVMEPFLKLLSQGMVHGKTYSDPSTGRFLKPSEVDLSNPDAPLIKGTWIAPNITFEKMSKSKHNGVDPTTCINTYGSDAIRAHILFSAPVSEILEWDESKIVGMERWFNRLWRVVTDAQNSLESFSLLSKESLKHMNDIRLLDLKKTSDDEANILLTTHDTIKSVSHCLDETPYGLNTVISDLTKFTNALASSSLPATASSPPSQTILYIALSSLLRLLAPITPALASECWEHLHSSILTGPVPSPTPAGAIPSIFSSPWPTQFLAEYDVQTLRARSGKTVAVQINGKLRFSTTIPSPPGDGSASSKNVSPEVKEWILSHLLESDEGKVWLRKRNDWEKRKRVIVVGGGKVVNVVF
ncbi:leucine-tRNA ligase [Paracoccidioides brasiliensis Pb18]|uniref:leucine--tRNA ligase n=1 Tax=Paracoccidioides brasiliensis (strain Pb18) TaxID=502780 RepID=C1GH07_PARBD|nr:leucine-tRNA ligase [Paracoccidioides brasiliensis Pb18]EEH50147.1 leucine-tRNA ligase [Paracoccidioides brasiliensis Pb18]